MFSDALIWKSRSFIICVGVLFVALIFFNIYTNTIGNSYHGVVLLKYTVQKKTFTIMKRDIKLSIHFQILLMCVDKTMELMIFATGNVYKKDIASLLRCNNDGTQNRIKWAQRLTLICFTLGVSFFVVSTFINDISLSFHNTFAGAGLASLSVFYYGNVSICMAKRLLKEPIVNCAWLGFCNFVIQIARPANSLFANNGMVIYAGNNCICVSRFHCMEGSIFRNFSCAVFFLLHVNNIYITTLGHADYGIILFKYKIGDNEYTIISVRRSDRFFFR